MAAASIDSPSSVFSSPVGRAAEPEHDERGTTRRRARRGRPGDRVHEQPVDAHREPLRRAERERERDQHGGARATTARRSSGHDSNSCSTHAPAEIAAATTTPHAGHCSRARSCTLGGGPVPGDVPDEADHRVGGRDRDDRRGADVGSVAHHEDREHRARRVAGDDPEPTRAARRAIPSGTPSTRCSADRGEQRDRRAAHPGRRSRGRLRWRRRVRRARRRTARRADERGERHDLARAAHGDGAPRRTPRRAPTRRRAPRPARARDRAGRGRPRARRRPRSRPRATASTIDPVARDDHGGRSGASSRMLARSRGWMSSSLVATVTPIVGRRQGGCGQRGEPGRRR